MSHSLHCQYCKEPTVYGDARNQWLDYHCNWKHKLWWRLKYKLIICPKQGHNYVYDGQTLGGDWIRCTNCNVLDEWLPGVHEPIGYKHRRHQ